MSQPRIEKLTPEQEALIPDTLEKWRKIVFSTERINQEKATIALEKIYKLMGFKKQQILFF